MRLPYPRGAVAVTCWCAATSRVALVTRAKAPNAQQWSLPGGKVELGETSLAAAARELREETRLSEVKFSPAPFTVSDVIVPADVPGDGELRYHYLIAQTFARTLGSEEPPLVAGDDAGEARWYSLDELGELCASGGTTEAVVGVVERALLLADRGLL